MTFSINFSNVSRRTTGLNIFEESYNVLLGFGMIIENNSLKWAGQCPKVIYILVMLTILVRHFLFLTTNFRCFHKMWFRLGVDKLLHLSITVLNSSWEKCVQVIMGLEVILFRVFSLM